MDIFKLKKLVCGFAIALAIPHASAQNFSLSNCVRLLMSRPTEVQEKGDFRKKYVAIAKPDGLFSKNESFHSYSRDHLNKLKQMRILLRRESQIPSQFSAEIRSTEEKIDAITQEIVTDKSYNLDAFNRLSYLHSQMFDFLISEKTLRFHRFSYATKSTSNRFSNLITVSVLRSEANLLKKWILDPDQDNYDVVVNDEITPPPLGEINGWRFVPTFANLGFSSILWALSRGIIFVGQSDRIQAVDGQAYLPSVFQAHDYAHAFDFVHESRGKDTIAFWDGLEKLLNESALPDMQQRLSLLTLFWLIHEPPNPLSRMKCVEELDSPTNIFKNVLARIRQKGDLAQALPHTPTEQQVLQGVETAVGMVKSLCPDLKFRAPR